MDKRDRTRRVGELTVMFGSLGVAVLAVLYVGIPVAGYVNELLFGPPPRDLSFLNLLVWLVIIPNIAAAPFFGIMWASNKLFSQYGDNPDE